MPIQASTEYDSTHTWQNANDRVSYQRALGSPSSFEEYKIAQAMLCANPLTPSSEIRKFGRKPVVPRKFGYRTTELGINDVLDLNAEPQFRANDDFSQSISGYQGSSYPSLDIT